MQWTQLLFVWSDQTELTSTLVACMRMVYTLKTFEKEPCKNEVVPYFIWLIAMHLITVESG